MTLRVCQHLASSVLDMPFSGMMIATRIACVAQPSDTIGYTKSIASRKTEKTRNSASMLEQRTLQIVVTLRS